MELKTFLFESKVTSLRMAKELGITSHYLSRIANKHVKPSKELANAIQLYTRGLVQSSELMLGWQEGGDKLEQYFESKNLKKKYDTN